MLRNALLATATWLIAAAFTNSAQAALTRFDFTGTVSSTFGVPSAGSSVSGYIVFDPSAALTLSDCGGHCVSYGQAAPAIFSFTTDGGFTLQQTMTAINIADKFANGISDYYVFQADLGSISDHFSRLELTLSNNSNPFIPNTSIPITPPDFSAFQFHTVSFFAFDGGAPTQRVQAVLTSLSLHTVLTRLDFTGTITSAFPDLGTSVSGYVTYDSSIAPEVIGCSGHCATYVSKVPEASFYLTTDGGFARQLTLTSIFVSDEFSDTEQYEFLARSGSSVLRLLLANSPGNPTIADISLPATPPSISAFLLRLVSFRGFEADGTAVGLTAQLTPNANSAPVANAGPDQSVRAGATVLLDGSGSSDDNTPTAALKYAWSFASTPAGSQAALVGASSQSPSFVVDVPGTYVVQLVVTDGSGLSSAPDEVAISSSNLAPTANAGPDLLVIAGNLVTLNGAASFDPESDPLTFSWVFTGVPAGSTAVLSGSNTSLAAFVPDIPGTYTVNLVVSDPIGPSMPDGVVITATSAANFAEVKIAAGNAVVAVLPPMSVTTSGNQNAFTNFLSQATVAIQAGDLATARQKLQQAIARTDGCVLRGAPDGNGPGRDWITDCAAQAAAYKLLNDALAAIAP